MCKKKRNFFTRHLVYVKISSKALLIKRSSKSPIVTRRTSGLTPYHIIETWQCAMILQLTNVEETGANKHDTEDAFSADLWLISMNYLQQ